GAGVDGVLDQVDEDLLDLARITAQRDWQPRDVDGELALAGETLEEACNLLADLQRIGALQRQRRKRPGEVEELVEQLLHPRRFTAQHVEPLRRAGGFPQLDQRQ